MAPLFDLRAVGANGAEHIGWKTVAKNAAKLADKVADGVAAGKKKDEGKPIDRYLRTAGEQRMYAHSDVTPTPCDSTLCVRLWLVANLLGIDWLQNVHF